MSNRDQKASVDVDTTPVMPTSEIVLRMRHEELVNSPTNPRKRFAEGPLRELAENLVSLVRRALLNGTLELGVQQPLFVRMHSVAVPPGKVEIIAGERRWRATELAMELVQNDADAPQVIERLMMLPVLVKDWSDNEVIEFQLIENLRREDLTPMEEADGYREMQKRGHSPEQIAEKVGTKVLNVYRALKWSRLPPLARGPFERGEIGKELANMISRLPGELQRRKATLVLLHGVSDWDAKRLDEAGVKKMEDACDDVVEPMSVREARQVIADDFLSSLDDVTFALDDAELMPVQLDAEGERMCGGQCLGCPFRVADNPLFADMISEGAGGARTGNMCTLPSCKAEKTKLQWGRDAAEAASKGMEVMEPEEAAKIFNPSYNGGPPSLVHGAKFVDLEAKPDLSLLGHANVSKVQPWQALLKDSPTPVKIIIAQDSSGRTRKLVNRESAVMAVNEKYAAKGKETPLAAAAEKRVNEDKYKEEQRKQAEEKKRDQRAYGLALAGLVTDAGVGGVDGWRMLARFTLNQAGMDGLRCLASGLGIKPPEAKKGETLNQGHYAAAICNAYVDVATVGTLQRLVLAAVVAQQAWRLLGSDMLKEACEEFGVNITEAKAKARDEIKAKKAGKAKGKANAKPGERGDTEGMYDRGQSGALVDEIEVKATEEQVYDASAKAHYHCDVCGCVCPVDEEEVDGIEMMMDGQFQCSSCDARSGYHPLPEAEQEQWASRWPDDPHGSAGKAGQSLVVITKGAKKVGKKKGAK